MLTDNEMNYESGLWDAEGVYAGPATFINNIERGNNASQRTGDVIRMISFTGTAVVSLGGGAENPQSVLIRFLLVFDRAPNGALAGIAELLQDVGVAGNDRASILSLRKVDQYSRFVILKDIKFLLTALVPSKKLVFRVGLKGKRTSFSGNSGQIADCVRGSLLLFQLSDTSVPAPTVSGQWRLRFRM